MTTVSIAHTPHGVKQWHLESLGLLAGNTMNPKQNLTTEIMPLRFSAWTPIENKYLNKQLFQERVRLISHWFDLWTDKQRKQFLHWILMKCNKSQLKFAETWFVENIPVTKVDFTSLLPRFISLYIFSFLSPKDLCAAAQVNWHWKFLTEQDCLWMPKCIRFGWFLLYTPAQNEYSAWKQHYIACAIEMDYLTPREATEMYGTLNEHNTETEEQMERLHDKYLRKIMREKLALYRKQSFKARPPWVSGTWSSGFLKSGFQPNTSQIIHDQTELPAALLQMKKGISFPNNTLSKQISEAAKFVPRSGMATKKQLVLGPLKTAPKRKNVAGCSSYPVLPHRHCWAVSQRCINWAHPAQPHPPEPHLVLISSNVSAYEIIVDSVMPGVVPVVYEHSGTTLESLFYYIEKALDGRTAKTIGILSDGDSRGINLLQGYRISAKNLLKPEVREFWEKLGSCVTSQEEPGYVDIFVPLAASEAGMEILSQLSSLTGVLFRAPTGIVTGSYQHILSEWLGNQKEDPPPSIYFTEVKLQTWLRWTELLEDALKVIRKKLRPYFCDLQKHVSGKIIGQIMFDTMNWSEVQDNRKVAQALTDGLVALSRGNNENPLEFLSSFLRRKNSKNKKCQSPVSFTGSNPEASLAASQKSGKLQEDAAEKRKCFVRELLISERNYVRSLEIVRDVYVKPLNAALASNRAILSYASVQTMFSDILNILQLNRWFLDELRQRLDEWSPAQNLGDVFIKFCKQLQTYTNFYNNYAVILKTIDKCRETIPLFRAFLKRHDRTVTTNMRSLQELLLCPSKRFEEYVTLLYALRLHSPPEHTDCENLITAIKQIKQYKDYLDQLKLNVGRADQILKTQRIIQGCPPLLKADRYLIRTQDVTQLSCCSEKVSIPYRLYEHIHDLSLFLFNDILVISWRSISYKPFEWTPKTTHQFLEVVPLSQLIVEDILDSKYIKNAFLLRGPTCQLICSTEEDDDKFIWLSALHRAISCSIEENDNYFLRYWLVSKEP
ncbi:epithelial cell-transforming sequence 2 oncogene-like isoform X2 [Hemicordylus capensis]|uniref:epithelial cell-transforming sequence 2 oncogene-like isoform X2 n=1 Tax=Hemicordylus capensis TaxID=884348 RepID=UPI0023021975|nr:epithelial cell-transforming sequence 2 oncogene-like isoform X2 [Hemicordylus capensis]